VEELPAILPHGDAAAKLRVIPFQNPVIKLLLVAALVSLPRLWQKGLAAMHPDHEAVRRLPAAPGSLESGLVLPEINPQFVVRSTG
jgi:hypothetical protein